MIYIETGSTDVYYNFGVEYYFTNDKNLGEPVFLFWRTSPTLMVGKYQNTLEEINNEYAKEHGIQIVRRMSGGGTIYTDMGGWQFTFIDYGDGEEIHFHEYISPVIDALRALGIPAEFNGRNDLVIAGKKFSGNAQFKLNGNTVHHGSLLFDTNIEQMVASTTVDDYKIISKSIKSVRDRVTNISEHLKNHMDADEFKKHMVHYIMHGENKTYVPTDEDIAKIKEYAKTKFDNWECKYGANPKYTVIKTGRFKGGKVEFRLDVKKGIIASASVCGDFFANEKADRLASVLVNCKYRYEDIISVLNENGMDGAIYGVSTEELANTIIGEN